MGYLGVNFEIRERGRDYQNTSDIEMSVYFTDDGIAADGRNNGTKETMLELVEGMGRVGISDWMDGYMDG